MPRCVGPEFVSGVPDSYDIILVGNTNLPQGAIEEWTTVQTSRSRGPPARRMNLEDQNALDFERQRVFEQEYLKGHSFTQVASEIFNHRLEDDSSEPDLKKQRVDPSYVMAQPDLSSSFNFSGKDAGFLHLPLPTEPKELIDTTLEKPLYSCTHCGQEFKSIGQRRKHCKEVHPTANSKKQAINNNNTLPLVPPSEDDPNGLKSPLIIDNALRTVFGMTQIKKMPGDVRDKRLRIQTLEKRILPKLVEWWGGNTKQLISDLLQTDFLQSSLHDYVRRERF
ncbi:hypothetical protein PROFUN_05480 [Planoprotostelium fungivorum]|uniref:C2H2-type domain-containing protein n=1 Tax=Planoprotostelium fungivorum TaxID=1890364 RepID=A0A2P6NQW0_9EUKA|nr:hypothetical protein PROFUN_05480 [Planoprotostelium fungivorum]